MKTPAFAKYLFVVAAIFASCAKEEDQPEDPTVPVNPGKSYDFRWTPTGANTVIADSAYFSYKFHNITAFKNGNANMVEIVVSDFTPGSYVLSSTTGNKLEWISAAGDQVASSGTVNITAQANSKVSGSFAAAFSGGSGLTGSFSDVPQR